MASSRSTNCVCLKPMQFTQACMLIQTDLLKPAMSLWFFTPLKLDTEPNEISEHLQLKSNKLPYFVILLKL